MPLRWMEPLKLSTRIIHAVKSNRPFSMLRLGDGEFDVMQHRVGLQKKDVFYGRFGRWFPTKGIPYPVLVQLTNMIIESFKGCDLLGIPTFREAYGYPKWAGLDKLVDSLGMGGKPMFYFYDIFTLWRKFDTFRHILTGRKDLYIITSRDVGKGLQERFSIGTVHTFSLQPEFFLWRGIDAGLARFITDWEGPKHYPTLFNKIRTWLDSQSPLRGKLFLVGAGGLGKIYCHWIRQRGGMAIDLGALFDGWAGLITRPYLQTIKEFKL